MIINTIKRIGELTECKDPLFAGIMFVLCVGLFGWMCVDALRGKKSLFFPW